MSADVTFVLMYLPMNTLSSSLYDDSLVQFTLVTHPLLTDSSKFSEIHDYVVLLSGSLSFLVGEEAGMNKVISPFPALTIASGLCYGGPTHLVKWLTVPNQ